MTRAISAAIIDLDGEPQSTAAADRRGAVVLGFALCLAFGSAFLGRDGSVALRDASPPTGATTAAEPRPDVWAPLPATVLFRTLSLPPNTTDVQFQVFPDWLANEQLPPAQYTRVRVRSGSGLAVEAVRPGDQRIVTWTEGGTVYWLISDRRDIPDLVRLADSLR
jgi:hypothetical protein